MTTATYHAVPLRPRAAAVLAVVSVVGIAAFGWPLLAPGFAASHSGDAPWLFVALLPLLLAVVLAETADGGIDAKAVAVLGVLAGIGAALRPLSGGATGFSFEFFLLVLAGRVLGRGFGFVLGALTLFASALLTAGVGPWLPFQMLAAGWTGFGAGCLPAARGRAEIALLSAYGAVTGLLYGLLTNLTFWPFAKYYPAQIAFVPHASLGTNLLHWWRFDLTTSLGFDIPRAVGNVVLIVVLGPAVLAALRRVGRKAAFAPTRTIPVSAEPAGAAARAG
jgi:energy-coupling factor transport system substrate-specific component